MKKKLLPAPSGRIRPMLLALLLVLLGIIDDRFWKLGLLVMLIVFVSATIRYTRTL